MWLKADASLSTWRWGIKLFFADISRLFQSEVCQISLLLDLFCIMFGITSKIRLLHRVYLLIECLITIVTV